MYSFRIISLLTCITICFSASAQTQTGAPIDSIQFFLEDRPLQVTLTTDLKVLIGEKPEKKNYIPATFKTKFPDSTDVDEQIRISTRGVIRRKVCYVPPIRLAFHNATSPRLYPLHTLKMVPGCKTGSQYEQYVLKEYLCYKLYNLITPMSYRARLMHVTYMDSKGNKKPVTQYAFLIESDEAMAKRNHCKVFTSTNVSTESTDRKQMTLVNLYEYMIANTDWAVPVKHNIKLIYSKKDSLGAPFAVAYDFDYAGLVNTDYAVPDEKLEIENVTTRLYRGFPRTMTELEIAIKQFNDQKSAVYATINNCEGLSKRNKQDMIDYIEDFYKVINDKRSVQETFIDNARKE
jgi:hypothetical protein